MKKLLVLFLFSSTAMAESYNLLCKNNIDKSLVDVYISYSEKQIDYGRKVGYWYTNGRVRFNNKSYADMTISAKDNYIQIKDIFSSDMFRYYKETKNLKRYANKMVSEYSCKDVDSLLD
tara:strand:+ start:151 stop:507 length:357 start_codon:yes stop_codon:yes gene_type:complete